METDDRIRLRAFFLYENDKNRRGDRALDDWLEAERQELAMAMAAAAAATIGRAKFDQDDAWYAADALGKMIGALSRRIRNRRLNSILVKLVDSYQDYMTRSDAVSDAEAKLQGKNSLYIYRLFSAFGELLAGGDVSQHSVSKELKDIFSEDPTTFDTSEFNIYSAARIQQLTGLPVTFINEGDDVSPDLRIDDLAYVECKDLHPASRAGLANSLQDNVDKAIKQLQTAQAAAPLRGTGICVDVPWGMLPLAQGEWQVITDALLRTDGPSFVLVSCSGVSIANGEIGFPVALALAFRPTIDTNVEHQLVRKLSKMSYRLVAGGGAFDQIRH